MNKEIVERSRGYWIVYDDGDVSDHHIFCVQLVLLKPNFLLVYEIF